MSYELRIGLLAVITIAVTVWGYKFMKGKNILSASNTYYVEYENIDELTASSPVYIRGLRVGTVAETRLSEDMYSVIATLDIQRGIKIHRETEALVVSTSIMGGKAVVLDVQGPCDGMDCAEPGDYLPGRVQGLLESLLGDTDLNEVFDQLKGGIEEMLGPVTDTLAGPGTLSALAQSFRNIQMILENVESLTRQLDEAIPAYDREIQGTLGNLESFTSALAEQGENIDSTLANIKVITDDLREAELGTKAGDFITSGEGAIDEVQSTIRTADSTLLELQKLIANMNSGQGTIGKLMTDDSLYTNLNLTARNLELLLQDFRLNPKRYVNVSVFGKKQKDYNSPEYDPAFDEERKEE